MEKSVKNLMEETEEKVEKDSFRRKLLKHRILKYGVITLVLVVIGALVYKFLINKKTEYSTYQVTHTYEFDTNIEERYYAFQSGVLRCMSEGVAFIKGGKERWNCGLSMSNPIVAVSDHYVVIADYNVSNASLISEDGQIYEITMSYPIVDLAVSNQGVIAAVLDDGTANYIELKDRSNEQIAMGRTVLQGDGYPVSLAISKDGTKLVVSYLSVNNGSTQSSVVFYNYSTVGENEVDRIVGGFNQYKTTVVPRVAFVGNDSAAAFGSDLFTMYEIKQKPAIKNEDAVTLPIQSVFYNDSYAGFCCKGEAGKSVIRVFETSGTEVMKYETDYAFTGTALTDNNVILYNDSSCQIIDENNAICFQTNFDTVVKKIIPVSQDHFYVISNNKIQEIELK